MKVNNKLFLIFLLLSAIDYLGQAQGLPLLSTLCFSQEDNTAKANEHFLAGNKLLEAGNYAQADAEFKKAQELLKAKAPPAPEAANPAPEEKTPEAPVKKTAPKPAKAGPKKVQPELMAAAIGGRTIAPWLTVPQDMTPEETISFYLRAVENLPRNPSLHYNLAVAYLKTGQYPRAAEAFKKAVSLNPKDNEAYYNLAVLYENHLGNKKQALFYYDRYLKLSPLAEDAQKVRLWMRQIKEEFKLNE